MPLGKPSRPIITALREQGWGVRDGAGFQESGDVFAIRVTVSQLTKREAQRFLADLGRVLGPR
jgi:DNA-binding transcriptional MocR family regulator